MNTEEQLLLIVEDNQTQQKVMKILADRYGFCAIIVASGAEALQVFSDRRKAIGAILMDLTMPDMDGLECSRRIRDLENGTARHVPIIAVTGHVWPEDRRKCLEAGMDDFLPKPFGLTDFQQIVQKWISYPFTPGFGPPSSSFVK